MLLGNNSCFVNFKPNTNYVLFCSVHKPDIHDITEISYKPDIHDIAEISYKLDIHDIY